MIVYIQSDEPLTLQGLVQPWKRLFGREGRNAAAIDCGQLMKQAAAYESGLDEAWWRAECEALRELAECTEPPRMRVAVASLVVPADLPARWSPLLAGWRVREWRYDCGPLSPLALLWLSELGAEPSAAPTGQVMRVEQAGGVAVFLFQPDGSPSVMHEVRDHTKEHVDEGMVLIQANLDDANPEWIAYVMERLFQAGANDVTVFPATMKKGRTGAMLQVLCYRSEADRLKEIILRETTTFGVRWFPAAVHRLARRLCRVRTEWGEVTVKAGYHRGERVQLAPEYEECARLAREHGVPLKEVYRAAMRLAEQTVPLRLPS